MDSITTALSKLTQVAIVMITPIFMCLFIGKWLDEKFNTGVVFLFIFLVLGVGSAFRSLYMFVIKSYKDEQVKEEANDYFVVDKSEINEDTNDF